jgi:hypothetical protein
VNVALRPLEEGDAAWLDQWFGAVAASVGYHTGRETPSDGLRRRLAREKRLRVRTVERDGRAVGVAVYRVYTPRRESAMFEFIGTTPADARRGSGMAAAALVEELLRAGGTRTVYAPAPAGHGIDVYFWIRLGYRPLPRAAWPCAIENVAWMRRDLS